MDETIHVLECAKSWIEDQRGKLSKADKAYPILNNLICLIDLSVSYLEGDFDLEQHIWEIENELEAFKK